MDRQVFLPVQQLNTLRREALAGLEEAIAEEFRRGAGKKRGGTLCGTRKEDSGGAGKVLRRFPC